MLSVEPVPEVKNIVVCCDGTNNEYGDHNSNVVLLYETLERESPRQVALYDPGVGTFAAHPFLTNTARRISRIMGAAFGRGITKNIIDAYTFVMQNYEKGDQVFLFGFSSVHMVCGRETENQPSHKSE